MATFARQNPTTNMFGAEPLNIPNWLEARLNTKEFRDALENKPATGNEGSCGYCLKLCGRTLPDGSEHDVEFICEEMLASTSVALPTSLLKMKHEERRSCVDMFNCILNWTSLSNGAQHVGERNQLLQQISAIAKEDSAKKDELYLQILKQTRGQMNRNKERNAWKLFECVIDSTTSSSDLSEFLICYFKAVEARASEEDPFVRRMAAELTEKLIERLCPNAKERTRATLERLCENTETCEVYFVDGREPQEVIYDSHTLIEHVVPQIAWTLGLEDHKTFTLFECCGDKQLRHDGKKLLTAVVNAPRFLDAGKGKSWLLMKKKIIRLLEEEEKDPKGFELTYAQAKHQYLQGGYPLEVAQAAQLCVYLIQSDLEISLSREDEMVLSKAVKERIPSTCFRNEDREEWVNMVRKASKKIGGMSVERARYRFLEELQRLPFGNCEFFPAKSVKCSNSQFPKRTPMLLAINRTGVHFFQDMPRQFLRTIELGRLEDCVFEDPGVSLKAKESMSFRKYCLSTDEGDAICRTVNRYVRYFRRSMQTNKRLQKDTATALVTENASCPSSGTLDWNAHRRTNLSDGHERLSGGELSHSDATRNLDVAGPSMRRQQSPMEVSSRSTATGRRYDDDSQTTSGSRTSGASKGDQVRGTLKAAMQSGRNTLTKMRNNARKSRACEEQASQTGAFCWRRGDTLRDTYRVTEPTIDGDPRLAAGVGIYCKTNVLLKFCKTKAGFEQAKERHKEKNRNHVCRLLQPIRGKAETPSCLVFERGDETLEQWMTRDGLTDQERLSVAFQLCRLMKTLHGEGIVHGDLKPSNVHHFFADDSWKLLETDTASVSGKPSFTSCTPEYASPEVLFSESEKRDSCRLTTAADIFSLGIVIYELLQGERFYSRELTREAIRILLPAGKLPDRTIQIEDDLKRSVIEGCLCLKPSQRCTASQICSADIFASARDGSVDLKSLSRNCPGSNGSRKNQQILSALKHQRFQSHSATVDEPILADLDIALCVEELIDNIPASNFAAEKGFEVLTTSDSTLQGQIIFLLNARKTYRLRIVIGSDVLCQAPFDEVVWVNIRLPDNNPVGLQKMVETTAFQYEVAAPFRVSDLESLGMSSNCDCLLDRENKYFALEIFMGVRGKPRGNVAREISLQGKMYCKMHNCVEQKLCLKSDMALQRASRHTPRWAKFIVRRSSFAGNTAVWESVP